MTLEEAKVLLAQYEEARQLVDEDNARRTVTAHSASCARGLHSWVRNDPRALRPYCNWCGTEKKP